MRRVRRSRPISSVPSQCAPFMEMKRSRRLVWAKPYGVIHSASTAAASMTMTMTLPIVPSGFRLSIWIQTSAHQGGVLSGRQVGSATAPPATRAPASAGSRLVADARVQERIREVDQEIQPDDHCGDDQVHRLDDGVVEPREGLEEEEPDPGQPEDRFDDH